MHKKLLLNCFITISLMNNSYGIPLKEKLFIYKNSIFYSISSVISGAVGILYLTKSIQKYLEVHKKVQLIHNKNIQQIDMQKIQAQQKDINAIVIPIDYNSYDKLTDGFNDLHNHYDTLIEILHISQKNLYKSQKNIGFYQSIITQQKQIMLFLSLGLIATGVSLFGIYKAYTSYWVAKKRILKV